MVRRSNDAYQFMKDASISTQKIEWSVKVRTDANTATNVHDLLKLVMFLYKEITDESNPMTKTEQELIVKKYMKLIAAVRDVHKLDKENYYLAPKPVTLEQKNLMDPDLSIGTVSILKNYAVTDKADGERMLLYVDDKSEAYLIDSVFEVTKLNVQVTSNALNNSLFDGEYITSTKKPIFAIFDVYFIGNENIMKEPLMPTRYAKMEMVINATYWKMNTSNISIEIKKHIAADGSSLFDVCKTILGDKNRPYKIDGLVFTPIDLPVFGYYPDQFKNIRGKSSSWEKVFKWKPPDQNTIDFLVKEVDGTYIDKETNTKYKRFKLYTGYDASKWEDITVQSGIKRIFSPNIKSDSKESNYEPRLFKPIQDYSPDVSIAFIPINQAGHAVSMEGEKIETNTIVEMSYLPDLNTHHKSLRWKANRVREDKTKMLKMTGLLTKTANDLSVALNIWQSIHSPVTLEHIIGQKPLPESAMPGDIEERMLGINDVYYAREIPRNHMLSINMFNFHNKGIKSILYSKSLKKSMLLELACGMAGDLPRWRENNFDFILGVDYAKHNIESAPSGSYARFLNQREEFYKRQQRGQRRLHYPTAMFLVGDCSLPLATGEAAKGKDLESEKILKLLYQSKVDDNYGFLNNYRMVGKATKQFDMVSCQFAIHYFFKNNASIEGFFKNVGDNLKKDGIFIATFMDGKKVHALINKPGKVEGMKSGAIVWAIQKQYKTFTKASPFGKLIDVYLENTHRFIPEYLVNFDVLVEKAAERNLELQSDGFFEATFNELYNKIEADDSTRDKSLDDDIISLYNDNIQTQFSFLNRWVIFKKTE
jgi:SAM-dependent methyltransferase